jgi:hypothetical protein
MQIHFFPNPKGKRGASVAIAGNAPGAGFLGSLDRPEKGKINPIVG